MQATASVSIQDKIIEKIQKIHDKYLKCQLLKQDQKFWIL